MGVLQYRLHRRRSRLGSGATLTPDDPNAGTTARHLRDQRRRNVVAQAALRHRCGANEHGQLRQCTRRLGSGTGSDTSSAGTIVATTDGGATWRPQSAGTDWALSGVTFVDARHGWLPEGESIYATTDGGVTWTKHDAGMPVTAVSFVDDLHGYAVGPGGAMATTVDGGATWQVCGTTTPAAGLPTPPFGHVGVSPLIVGLAFPDATHGWAVAGHTILATTDGGDTWTGRTVSADLTGVSFPDTAHGWAWVPPAWPTSAQRSSTQMMAG